MEDICQVLGWHLLWLILYLAIHGEPGNYNSDRKYMSSDDSCKLRVESWGGGGGGCFESTILELAYGVLICKHACRRRHRTNMN